MSANIVFFFWDRRGNRVYWLFVWFLAVDWPVVPKCLALTQNVDFVHVTTSKENFVYYIDGCRFFFLCGFACWASKRSNHQWTLLKNWVLLHCPLVRPTPMAWVMRCKHGRSKLRRLISAVFSCDRLLVCFLFSATEFTAPQTIRFRL